MAEDHLPLPICVMKVNLNCCESCPIKVKKNLQKIEGVRSINTQIENGLVIVSGFVDPPVLQKEIKKMGKKAELLAYERDPIEAKKKLDRLSSKTRKGHSCNCDSDSDSDDREHGHPFNYLYTQREVPKGPAFATSMQHYPNYGMGSNVNGLGWHGQGQGPPVDPRIYGGFRGMLPPPLPPPPPQTIYGSWPPLPSAPPLPRPNLPLSNLYAIYSGQTDPPVGNSMYHSFSDDNVKACSII